jgi:uncharacterized tellurite resistance protein B-like protein
LNKIRKEHLLAKTLAGAAWADGEVTPAETERIRSAAGELGLTSEEWADVEAILAKPIGVVETESLACEFLSRVSPSERAELLKRLEDLFLADGKLDAAEMGILSSLKAWDDGASGATTLIDRMRNLITRSRGGSSSPSSSFERIASRMRGARDRGTLSAQDEERAVLFGAILYRTAYADGRVDKLEISQLRGLLTAEFRMDDEEAAQVVSVIGARAAEEMDRQRLCASFNRVASMDERLRLLGCLFSVAKADGRIDEDEMREIRLAANYLWIDARSFNDMRTRAV